MPLTRFDPPAGIDDLDTDPLRKAWSDKISSVIDSNKAGLKASLGANPPQFFNELTDPKNMADRVEQDIIWQGFPRLLERQFGENTTAAFKHAEDDTPAATPAKPHRTSISSGTSPTTIRRPKRSCASSSPAKVPNTGSFSRRTRPTRCSRSIKST